MSVRLRLAVEHGHVVLPAGETLVIPRDNTDMSVFDPQRTRVHTRSASLDAALTRAGWSTETAGSDWSGAVIFLPRAKDAQRAAIRHVRDMTDAPIIIDGDKTDGVDAIFRDLKTRADVSESWSKAHGKIFSFEGGFFEDWPLPKITQSTDGWHRAPGVFSADRIDPASQLLADALPREISGRVIDLGAGWGYLAQAVVQSAAVAEIELVEDDTLALAAAKANVTDIRAAFHWADALNWRPSQPADHVVCNPPFHKGRAADPSLGQAFIRAAATMLKPKGSLWLVANRHLPYETSLKDAFRTLELHAETASFKVFHAKSPTRRKG